MDPEREARAGRRCLGWPTYTPHRSLFDGLQSGADPT